MASTVIPIGKPNYVAIAGMQDDDLMKTREYYIVILVSAHRRHDSDTIGIGLDWLEALTSEMRVRGSPLRKVQPAQEAMPA